MIATRARADRRSAEAKRTPERQPVPTSAADPDRLEVLRRVLARHTEDKSLRAVAREIGMSPTGLKKFLQGTTPYSATLRRLRRWYFLWGWKHEAAHSAEAIDTEQVRMELDAYEAGIRIRSPFTPTSTPLNRRSQRTAARTRFVLGAFTSDAELARLLGVNPSRVERLKQGTADDDGDVERLAGLDIVLELLTGFLDERSIPKWLEGTNAHLGDRRPIDVLRQGRLSEVIAAVEAEKSGAYA